MENYILVKQDELCHFGILGMKWGVRRYQNKDGSLTEAGRKRRGEDAQKLGQIQSQIDRDTFNEYSFRKAGGTVHADSYKESINNGKESYNKLFNQMKDKYGEQNLKDLENIPEFKNAAKTGKYWLKELEYFKEREAFNERYKNMSFKEAKDYLKNEQLFDETMARKDPERANKVAKFGLEVMRDQMGNKDLDPNDKGWKDWFIWEDQTIGYGTIADMALRGKDLNSIKKTIAIANNYQHDRYDETGNDYRKDYEIIPGAFQLNEGYKLDGYAKACLDQLEWKKD